MTEKLCILKQLGLVDLVSITLDRWIGAPSWKFNLGDDDGR